MRLTQMIKTILKKADQTAAKYFSGLTSRLRAIILDLAVCVLMLSDMTLTRPRLTLVVLVLSTSNRVV